MQSPLRGVLPAVLSAMFAAFLSADAATLTLGDATLSGDRLTVPVTVSGSEGGQLELYLGEAGPKDGEPSATSSAVAQEISGDGTYSLTAQISVGAKIAYRAVLGSDASASGVITATDSAEYVWVDNSTGLWSDPANWTRASNDGLKNIGYPAYKTGNLRFNGNQTAEVTVDADYSFGDLFIDNQYLTLTIHGNGHTLKSNNSRCVANNTILLDNVRFLIGSIAAGANSTLTLENGAYLETRWWLSVSGANASLFVGSGCEIKTSTDGGYWYGVLLEGANAKIEIDDALLTTPRIQISPNDRSNVPSGIVFKGKNPRLAVTQQDFNVHGTYEDAVALKFVVPVGGFTGVPITKSYTGNYVAMGDSYIDHEHALAGLTSKIRFEISGSSPFFASLDEQDIKLFDWNKSGINADRVEFGALDNPESNRFSYEDDGNQVWVRLKGTGMLFDRDLAMAKDDSTATVTATTTVSALGEGTTTATCYVRERERNGRVSAFRQLGDAVAVTETGTISFSGTGVLGTFADCYVVFEVSKDGQTVVIASHTNAVELVDHDVTYIWYDNRSGYWSDSGNWQKQTNDELPRIGYPANGGTFSFHYSNGEDVYIDADYSGFSNGQLAWNNAVISLLGVSDDAALTTGLEVFDRNHLTVSNVAIRTGSYHVKENASLTLLDGASITTSWEFNIEGENATCLIGSNCFVTVGVAEDWHGTQLCGGNASLTLDNGTLNATYMWIGRKDGNAASAPGGIVFKGEHPRLNANYLRNRLSDGQTTTFSFEIPEGGYDDTPIHKRGWNGDVRMLARVDGDAGGNVIFKIADMSPYLKIRGNFTQQLADWTYGDVTYQVDTTAITFATGPHGEEMYFTPVEGDAKSGIAVDCCGKGGFVVILK